ncbi:CHASE domain-containing protein [Martelella endophytica]|uniref:CHASE domain-containing protein n=1 Tax=Martelella endophytica TaxID=1486262 RepID=UPI0006970B29|nr:CHASE domain-containing protein [Martelella endophytica]
MRQLFDKARAGDITTVNRFLPVLVFVVVTAIGLGMSFSIYRTSDLTRQAKFEIVASDAADRLTNRLYQHMSLLEATKSFFEATGGQVTRAAFKTYVAGLDTEDRYDGIQGIGFARVVRAGNEATAEAMIADNYGTDVRIWPAETDQKYRAAIVMLEPDDERNHAAIGYDMYSEQSRREAMAKAFATDTVQATGPVRLVQEITPGKQTGFLIYMPFRVDNPAPDADGLPFGGFIYAPFRTGDLYEAVMGKRPVLPVALKAYDKDVSDFPLYISPDFETSLKKSGLDTKREIEIAGRIWVLEMTPDAAFEKTQFDVTPFVVGSVALLLAVALAMAAQWQLKALAAAREVQRVTEKSLQERDLMLQEMKHRIKNSIARVLAMARQTAHHSEDLPQFMESYSARLQAMSTAQDVLTRSHWQRADLKELLSKELAQVFGGDESNFEVYGPEAELDEKATQACSLTFHELATNALKYGGMANEGVRLVVSWSFSGFGDERVLKLTWNEQGETPVEKPSRKGFGTRLIDANIIGELNGSIERHYEENGLRVEISFPHPEEQHSRKSRWRRRSRLRRSAAAARDKAGK